MRTHWHDQSKSKFGSDRMIACIGSGPFDTVNCCMDLRAYPQNVQTLILETRRLLLEWLPGVKETEDDSPRMFAYAYGPGYRGMICTLIPSKAGVKVGIVGGASFPDPHALLRGSGKVHRHVPLKSADDLLQPGIKQLVVAAGAACHERLRQK